jgi:sarcosine oxidase subunit beta
VGCKGSTADVVVIGGGILGCSICYYLARAGVDVLLLERNHLACGASSAGQGTVDDVGHWAEMARLSNRLYAELEEELSCDIGYVRGTSLRLLDNEADYPAAALSVENDRENGHIRHLLTRDQARDLEPNVAPDIGGAILYPVVAHVNPMSTCFGLARAAGNLGARILTHTEALDIRLKDGQVRSVLVTGGEIRAPCAVIAAGIWAPALGQRIGLDIPIFPRRGQIIVTERVPKLVNRLRVREFGVYEQLRDLGEEATQAENVYVRRGVAWNMIRTEHDNYLIGTSRDFAGWDNRTTADVVSAMAQRAIRFIPRLREVSCVRTYAGLRQYTADLEPIMGKVDGIGGLVLALGFEGWGITAAPGVGKVISELIVEGRTSIPIERHSYSRFRRNVRSTR